MIRIYSEKQFPYKHKTYIFMKEKGLYSVEKNVSKKMSSKRLNPIFFILNY